MPYASIEGSVGGAVMVVTFSFKHHHLMQTIRKTSRKILDIYVSAAL
jgi:hypothetical protein